MKPILALSLALSLALTGCPKPGQPQPSACASADPDAGTVLQTPCAGMPDDSKCCLGATPGKCRSGRCAP